ncbi:MAG TPA: prolipoprotein diacylglyceryl transferase family protein [Ktedonobacteraceae bacterium]|nr:prolipoprotein diacylglyceryl transferase family protein [Ktedonobacteraceae bacterium]
MEIISVPLAFLLNWGWLQIGPYIHLDINPVLFSFGPLALHWYGLMYVVAIVMGLWLIRWYTARQGITENHVFRLLWWCVVAGVIGGRLYFVIQQPDLVANYLLKPGHILASRQGAPESPGRARCGRALRRLRPAIRAHWQPDQWRYHWLSQHAALVHRL